MRLHVGSLLAEAGRHSLALSASRKKRTVTANLLDQLINALAKHSREVARLEDALKKYGDHTRACSAYLTEPPTCDCGYEIAVEGPA